MDTHLKPEEARVLGSLIEKSLSQPQYYPMTLNGIVNACNQKTNRDPVTAYTESDVGAAIASLRRRQLISQAEPEPNSRSIKFRHDIETRYGWNAAQRAIMAELLLRGPQTLGEIRSRANRMTHLASPEYARELMEELEKADPPLIQEMEREPGKSARRFAQLLTGPPEIPEPVAGVFTASVTAEPAPAPAHVPESGLENRVEALESQVASLKNQLSELRNQLGA